jgi:hypothetical protein
MVVIDKKSDFCDFWSKFFTRKRKQTDAFMDNDSSEKREGMNGCSQKIKQAKGWTNSSQKIKQAKGWTNRSQKIKQANGWRNSSQKIKQAKG